MRVALPCRPCAFEASRAPREALEGVEGLARGGAVVWRGAPRRCGQDVLGDGTIWKSIIEEGLGTGHLPSLGR